MLLATVADICQHTGQPGLVLCWVSDYQTPGKSKSQNTKAMMHLSNMAKVHLFLLTIFPPVDYHSIPWFFHSVSPAFIFGQMGSLQEAAYIPGPMGAFLKFPSPASLNRCWGSLLGLGLRLIAQFPSAFLHTSGLTTCHLHWWSWADLGPCSITALYCSCGFLKKRSNNYYSEASTRHPYSSDSRQAQRSHLICISSNSYFYSIKFRNLLLIKG